MYTETNHFHRDNSTYYQIDKHNDGSRNSLYDDDSLWDDDVHEQQVAGFHSRDYYGDSDSKLSSSSSSSPSLSSVKSTEEVSRLQKHRNRADHSVLQEQYEEHDGSTGSVTSSVSSVASSSSAISVQSVLDKLENFILQTVIAPLSEQIPNYPSAPEINACSSTIGFKRKLSLHHLSQARSLTSIIMVASFCYDLLAPPRIPSNAEDHLNCNTYHPRKTTTAREVYYFYVTHFRDQRECDKAIWDLVCILELPSRQCLGIVASPRGWFCGSINIYNAYTNELKFNGRELDVHGMAITPSTYDNYDDGTGTVISRNGSHDINLQQFNNSIRIESDARCILVVEKEGVYTRLSEDKFFLRHLPCILVTGKGFPDVATRRWVRRMQMTLNIPVYGLWWVVSSTTRKWHGYNLAIRVVRYHFFPLHSWYVLRHKCRVHSCFVPAIEITAIAIHMAFRFWIRIDTTRVPDLAANTNRESLSNYIG